jgi:hypothetical protein
LSLLRRLDHELPAEVWSESEPFDDCVPELDKAPEPGAYFAPFPRELARVKNYAAWAKDLKSYLYRERTLPLWSCPALKESSRPAESEREFRLRLVQASREERDQKVDLLRAKYGPKLEVIQDDMRRANERLAREQAQASRSSWDATIAMGSSVLGAFLGQKRVSKTSVTRAATAAKAANRAAQQREGASQAASSLDSLRERYTELQDTFQLEIERLDATLRPEALAVLPSPIRPKKTDITVERVVLAWIPYHIGANGRAEAGY